MTIYPNTDYDTFCLLADAETILINNVPSSQLASWTALADADKEILLRQSTLLIENKITLPSTLESKLQKACAYLALYSVGVDMTNSTNDSNVKVDEVVGVVKTEYFAPNKSQNSFPDIVEMLLSGYGVTSDDSFSFVRG